MWLQEVKFINLIMYVHKQTNKYLNNNNNFNNMNWNKKNLKIKLCNKM